MANQAFLWGRAGEKLTPAQVEKERAAADLLAKGAMDYSPVAHWSQGLNRVAQGLLAGIDYRRADNADADIASRNKELIANALSGGTTPAVAPVSTSSAIPMTGAAGEASATAPGMQQYRDAIAGIESAGSGDYSAVGPTNDKLGRALGRYQIMEANIGPWSQAALGRAVTPEEFMADPKLQDTIFDHQFGQYVQKYGPEGAAQAWLGGEGGVGQVGRKDALGTSIGEYGNRFTSALGGSPQAAIEAVSPAGGSLSDEVAAFEQTPAYSEQFPGQNVATLRPFKVGETRPNADGSYSTEITTTWQTPDGAWVNVPSLWMGANGPQQFDANDEDGILGAMQQYEAQNGPAFKRYASVAEAEAAAQDRSSHGGAGAGSQIGQQQTVNTPQQAPMVQEVAQAQPASQPSINPAIIEALSDPQATPQTRAIAQALLQQQQGQQEQAAQQQQWMERQKYEQQQKDADPLRRQQLELGQLEIDQARQPKRQPLINAGNGNVYDPNTEAWITAPGGGEKGFRAASKDEANTFGAAAGQFGPDGKFYPLNPPQGTSLQVDPTTGAVTFNQGVGVKPLTEGQSKDSFFTTRMTAAAPTLDAYEGALMSLPNAAAGAIPMNLGNYAQSEEYQLARDAGRDFVTAYLRKDSGAALTPAEEKMYGELLLPQPGDKEATVQAKRTRRQIAVEAIKSGMPASALDGVLKAINAVPGADKPTQSTRKKTSSGIEWSLD